VTSGGRAKAIGALRTAACAAAIAVAAWLLCCAAVRLHQARALAEARESLAARHPSMVVMRHLGRCASLAGPGGARTTGACLDMARGVMGGLARAGRHEDLRVARGILLGAAESSSWKGWTRDPSRAPLVAGGASPAGAHPIAASRIDPREPWAFLGCAAGTALFALLSFHYARTLFRRKRPRPENGRAWPLVAAAASLLAAFAVFLLAA